MQQVTLNWIPTDEGHCWGQEVRSGGCGAVSAPLLMLWF